MKSVPLYEAKNRLSALIDEVEATGEDIVITRHGKPAARLARARMALLSDAERKAVGQRLLAALDRQDQDRRAAEARGEHVPTITWEELKSEMYDDIG